MNVYKPLIIFNVTKSIRILSDSMKNFCQFLVEGLEINEKKIAEYVEQSLMLVTALSPIIGYDKASKMAHYALDNNLSLKEANQKLNMMSEAEFVKAIDPQKMVHPHT